MKRIKTILTSALVLGVAGLTSLVVAAGSQHATKAVVRSIHGPAQYKNEGGDWMKLRVNQELTQGSEIKTEEGGEVYVQVNGFTSTVKIAEKTEIKLDKMLAGSGDTSTDLKLDGGKVLGSVKKLSANSDYSVTVPNGVAGIRGTDFQVSVTSVNGNLSITFTSVTGTVVCQVSAPPTGPSSETLTTGQSWTVTASTSGQTLTVDAPVSVPVSVLNILINELTVIGQFSGPPTVIITTPTTTTFVPPVTPPSSLGGSGS